MRMPVLVARKQVRILLAENLRFPGEGSSAQGKSGPKPRPKGAGDGQRVKIPVPSKTVITDAGTQEEKQSVFLECTSKRAGGQGLNDLPLH